MEKTTMRPLIEEEKKTLIDRSANAIIALKAWKECMKEDREKDGAEENPMEKMLQNCIDIFTELRRQWMISTGNPEEISGATLKKILDATLRIVRQELRNGTL